MLKLILKFGFSIILIYSIPLSKVLAQQLSPQENQMILDTAASICNTIKDAKGHKSDSQLEGDVSAQLGGLFGKIAGANGNAKGSVSRQDFEGISRDATATAFENDRSCREHIFDKMFDKLSLSGMPRYSTTCKFTSGERAGETQFYPPGTPGLTPALVGAPCTDGAGDFGYAVAD